VFDGRFPVVHADSLSQAILASLNGNGAYIVSDQMATLKSIALILRQHADSYVPLTAPIQVARAGATLLEWAAARTRIRPIMARVQIDFITKGIEPFADRIIHEAGWQPRSLEQGLGEYCLTHRTE
jgi:hypothetical protein